VWKNTVQPDRPQMTTYSMNIAYWIPKATSTLRIRNPYWFSNVKMVERTRLNVRLYVQYIA
jgi:hypothetical protein